MDNRIITTNRGAGRMFTLHTDKQAALEAKVLLLASQGIRASILNGVIIKLMPDGSMGIE